MAFLILFGMILFAAGKMMRRNEAPAADKTAPAHDDLVLDIDELLTPDSAAGNPVSFSTSLGFVIGPDTHYGTADHLYRQLEDVGIKVFMDDYDLTPGNEIGPELKGAIKWSRISIAILSRVLLLVNGASGICTPTSLYRDALLEHERRFPDIDKDIVEEWRRALVQTASVVQLLKEDYQYADDKLVGIDHHVQGMMKKLGVAYREGRAIKVQGEEVPGVEIWGEQGVGKTTLAKAVFYKMRKLFDAHSFLEISVDKEEQIKALAGKLTWFGPGSRIIVTINKKNIFKAFDVGAVEEHTVKPMDQRHAHKLFCLHAFQGDAARDVSEYFGLSLDIAEAIGGLPSEIVRQASSLREEMNMTRWKTTLGLLQKKAKSRKKPHTFQVSYSGGSEHENSI
ncbi:disease resistance protein RML1B-like [Eucalyptus grandis]|uniref:disease resistance protein RML1B-like n=1 Tax=Eucalyptus grandis TaxID=71139 RepID=UPI00192EBB00|nr:disease resistance protein RML1B-like [Eucalyptus grandis]